MNAPALRSVSVAAFKKLLRAYTGKYLSTPEKANATLIRLGIYTKKGKLNKNYRNREP